MVEDYIIVKQALTMRQVVEDYGFHPNKKGFIKCPFHSNSDERTPSLKVYEGQRGFCCHGCHAGGDVIKFVSLLNNLSNQDALKELASRFNILISDDTDITEETRQRATEARNKRERQFAQVEEKKAEIKHITMMITAYRNIIEEENRMSELYAYCYNKCQYLEYMLGVLSEKDVE